MRADTGRDWRARIDGVVRRLVGSLDSDGGWEAAAAEAAASPWHFHRRFRELTGESYEACLRRLRLERAACRLKDGASVLDAALDAGYSGPEAFSRKFKREFGINPGEVARLPWWKGLLPSCAGIHYGASGRHWVFSRREGGMETKLVELPARRIAGLRAEGGAWGLPRAWHRLSGVVDGLAVARESRVWLSAFWERSGGKAGEDGRYMAAFELPPDAPLPPGLEEALLPAGLHAVLIHSGPTEGIGPAVDAWEREWFPESGWVKDLSRPCYEWYQNREVPSELIVTFWCCPVAGETAAPRAL